MKAILNAIGDFDTLPLDKRRCIDVGAYHGSWSKALSDRGAGPVYAIEADCDNNKVLLAGLKGNIIPCRCAISSEKGNNKFYYAKHPDGRAGSSQSNSLDRKQLERKPWADIQWDWVKCHTMDSFCKKHGIDKERPLHFVKLNCEGGEYEIFINSPTHSWLSFTQSMYVAFHNLDAMGPQIQLVRELVEEHGFIEHALTLKDRGHYL